MASNQGIKYTPQCGDLTVESLVFYNNNVMGIFGYLQTTPAYHDICKYFMNCPLAGAFTKSPSAVYQNLLREIWCTTIASHPNPPTDDFEVHPLKEYLIKFSVMNGKKPLTLNFKTLTKSTGLDYAKGKYVSHLSIEEVNSAYCLLTGTKVDIGEIIYSDLVTKLTNKSRQKYVSYTRFASCALEVLLGLEYTHDASFRSSPTILSNSNFLKDPSKVTLIELTAFMVAVNNNEKSENLFPFFVKKKKGKSQTVTTTLLQSQGPEASVTLPQKRKKPKSKKTPSETKVTPPKPTKGFKKSHSVYSGNIPNPQDLERNIQLAGTGLPSPSLEEGTRTVKIMSLPKGPLGDKDLEGNKTPADMEPINPTVVNISGTGAEYQVDETQSTRLRYQTLTRNKAFLLSEDEMAQESDDEEVFDAGEDMDEDTRAAEEEHQSLPSNTDKPESSHTQDSDESASESSSLELNKYDNILPLTKRQLIKYLRKVSRVIFKRITEQQWEKHKEAVVSYADLRAFIEGYYEENANHMDQTDKDVVKEDPALNKKVIEATEAYIKNSTHLTELLTLIKNFDFQGLMSSVESLHATILSHDKSHQLPWLGIVRSIRPLKVSLPPLQAVCYKQHLLSLEGQQMLRENITPVVTKEPPSYTERETEDLETQDMDEDNVEKEQFFEEPKHAVLISSIKLTKTPEPRPKLVKASSVVRPDPDAPILVPYMINGKLFYLTEEQIQAHLDKEDQIKKAEEEAKRLANTKSKVIKIVQEEAKKIRIDPKKVISAKAGEKFKKAQDAEMQVHKRQHTEKVKRLRELNKKRSELYKWTISSRLKPEPITDVKIHLNSKLEVLIYRNNDKRNFVVYNPFKFADFGPTELDELFCSPCSVPEQAPSQSSGRKRKHMELEPKIKVPGLECKKSLHEGVPFVNNMVIEEPEYRIFFTDVFNPRECQVWPKLKKLIADHRDQEKLKSKKVKLEAVGYMLD
ncbi:hypothetical protein Tco_0698683 [Tanacetum coccineum]